MITQLCPVQQELPSQEGHYKIKDHTSQHTGLQALGHTILLIQVKLSRSERPYTIVVITCHEQNCRTCVVISISRR